jgi:hypothetical protein
VKPSGGICCADAGTQGMASTMDMTVTAQDRRLVDATTL